MKRLVFCFDGSWNHLSAPIPTNVVLTAESITPVAKDCVTQIIHYDPGVGTGEDDKWKGGLFGEGLIDKIADGYTFLAFNYESGDEIFVFGFSRGAFTARAFVGLIRQVGIVQRKHASKIADAIDLYRRGSPVKAITPTNICTSGRHTRPNSASMRMRTRGGCRIARATRPAQRWSCASNTLACGIPSLRSGSRAISSSPRSPTDMSSTSIRI